MEKGIRLEQLPAALGQLRGFGIRVGLFLQFGYPGEDWDALLRTVELVRRLKPDAIGISVSYPLPGTRFYQPVSYTHLDVYKRQRHGRYADRSRGAVERTGGRTR